MRRGEKDSMNSGNAEKGDISKKQCSIAKIRQTIVVAIFRSSRIGFGIVNVRTLSMVPFNIEILSENCC